MTRLPRLSKPASGRSPAANPLSPRRWEKAVFSNIRSPSRGGSVEPVNENDRTGADL